MSIESWKNEFYLAETMDGDEQAVIISLLKWGGALKANASRHGCWYENHAVLDADGNQFKFGSEDCSLCVRYRDGKFGDEDCFDSESNRHCPIVRASGKPCDGNEAEGEWDYVPSTWYQSVNNPTPMLALLFQALAHVKNGN